MFNVVFGLASGINIVLCLECLWEHNYSNRGIVTGFVKGSFYLGTFIFGMLAEYFVNPKGVKSDEYGICPNEIAERVPMSLKVLTIIVSLLLAMGICMIERVKRKIQIKVSQIDISRDGSREGSVNC